MFCQIKKKMFYFCFGSFCLTKNRAMKCKKLREEQAKIFDLLTA